MSRSTGQYVSTPLGREEVRAFVPKPLPVRGSADKTRHTVGSCAQYEAGVLDVGYYEVGANSGPAVLLLHGWPYDIHSYVDVAPMLAARGCRVVVPHLRGHGGGLRQP